MNTKNEEKDVKEEPKTAEDLVAEVEEGPAKPMRQIVIETDGNNIQLVKAEVGGKIELIGILQNVIAYLSKQQ